jgi:HSP20 family protein
MVSDAPETVANLHKTGAQEEKMSSVVRWEPLGSMMTLRDAMDRLFEESVVGPRAWLTPRDVAQLALDMYETSNDLVITAAVSGVSAEDVDITVIGDVLTIKGETKFDAKSEKANYHRQERRYGSFVRAVALPVAVQVDKADAKFVDGVLTLTLPKAESAKPRSIRIKAEAR